MRINSDHPYARSNMRLVLGAITASNADRVQLLRTLEGHTDWVNSVVLSSDRQLLASGVKDRTCGCGG